MTRHHRRKSFSKNLFLSVGAVFLLFALCFSIYQYKREKDFKLEIMQSHLQAYSYDMMRTLGDDLLASPQRFKDFVMNHNIRGLRATVIAPDGKVLHITKNIAILPSSYTLNPPDDYDLIFENAELWRKMLDDTHIYSYTSNRSTRS